MELNEIQPRKPLTINVEYDITSTLNKLKEENTALSMSAFGWITKLQNDINKFLNREHADFLKSVAKETAEKFVSHGVNPMPLTNYEGRVVSINYLVNMKAVELLKNPEKRTMIEGKVQKAELLAGVEI